MKRLLILAGMLLVLVIPAAAQSKNIFFVRKDDTIQEFNGTLATSDDLAQLQFINLERGDTIYVFVQGSGAFDPVAVVFNAHDFNTPLQADDDGGGGTNALLQYTISDQGDYIVAIWTLNDAGDFRVVTGLNTPDVLNEAISDATFNSEMNSASSSNFSCDSATRAERPVLSGAEQIMDHPEFLLHYTLEGVDATTAEFATILYVAVDTSLNKHHETGWTSPIPDCGEGGDNRFDIYIQDLGEGFFGYASPDNAVGDNPGTVARELNAYYAHLVMDNDMVFEDADPILLLQTTATHELHHAVQFGYDGLTVNAGFYEGGAVWMQNQVYPGDPLMYDVVQGVFDFPDMCVWSRPLRDGFSRIYGEWLMIDSIVRDFGARSYQQIWENIIVNQGFTGFYEALSIIGTTPQDVILRMGLRNLLHDYALADSTWGTVLIEATAAGQGTFRPRLNGVQQLGVDYVRVTAEPGIYSFETAARDLRLVLVGIDTTTQVVTTFEMGQRGVVDTTPFNDVYVMVINTGQPAFPDDCVHTDWSLRIGDGSGFPTTPASRETWSAAKYVPAN